MPLICCKPGGEERDPSALVIFFLGKGDTIFLFFPLTVVLNILSKMKHVFLKLFE